MKLIVSTENKVTKDKKGENIPHLKITEIVLFHCNVVNNDNQHDSRVLYTFIPNKHFGQYFTKKIIYLTTFNSEVSFIKGWLTDQNSKLLEVEENINLTLVITFQAECKMRYSVEPRDQILVKGYEFLSLAKNTGKNMGKNISKKNSKN